MSTETKKYPGNRRFKEFVRKWFPFYGPLAARLCGSQHKGKSLERVFSDIYDTDAFEGEESGSGPGSDIAHTASIRAALPELLKELGAETLLDAPCGDFHWIREIRSQLGDYIGADIVPSVIAGNTEKYADERTRFMVADIAVDTLPQCDAIMCRDCFVHLPFSAIHAAMKNFKATSAKFLLTTTYPETKKNVDIIAGLWRPLNLRLAPFNFPESLKEVSEESPESGGDYSDKLLSVWKLADVPDSSP